MSYTVTARQEGATRADAAGRLRHAFRDVDRAAGREAAHSNPRIRPGLTGLNESRIWDRSSGCWRDLGSVDEIMDELDARLANAGGQRVDKRGRVTRTKVRSNAKVIREIVLQLDPDWTRSSAMCIEDQAAGDGRHTDEVRERLRQMVEYFSSEVYGADNMLAFSMHLDETTPHLHLFVTPIDERGRVRHESFIKAGRGPKSGLARVDRGLRRWMIERGYDADPEPRGVRKSHMGIEEYARHARQQEELAADRVEVEDRRRSLDARAADLDAREAALPALRRRARDEGHAEGRAAGVEDGRREAAGLVEQATADRAAAAEARQRAGDMQQAALQDREQARRWEEEAAADAEAAAADRRAAAQEREDAAADAEVTRRRAVEQAAGDAAAIRDQLPAVMVDAAGKVKLSDGRSLLDAMHARAAKAARVDAGGRQPTDHQIDRRLRETWGERRDRQRASRASRDAATQPAPARQRGPAGPAGPSLG